MGSYKQLMVFTSVFEMYYAMLDGAADVTVFAHGFAVVVFREYLPNSWVPSIVSMALVIAYCVTFGMCMAILASHFMYRYSVTDSTFHHCYLSGKKYYLLFMAPFVYAIWWTSALLYGYSPNAESDEYLKARFLDTFDLRLDQISYKQIFNALVIQTIIPVVLMYLLILVFFLCPMINVNLGYSSRFVSDMVALYPVIDPLPNMFIIKTYRKGIIDVYLAFLMKPVPIFPAMGGYTTGILATWFGISSHVQMTIMIFNMGMQAVAIFQTFLAKHQAIVSIDRRRVLRKLFYWRLVGIGFFLTIVTIWLYYLGDISKEQQIEYIRKNIPNLEQILMSNPSLDIYD
ncbi:hypothetical protein L3Y34_006726 [Caenorhabditis briggsae]|uniref:Uncharacterized protein n=1 Tax=Caenorhabditis briggsae TaxID=6238 RepID=A0AAE9CY27_CAEBR|nr:hypothetical protein L3Y34_006726 [Caenorhabditis briggsae]